jgi:hypothetical protein
MKMAGASRHGPRSGTEGLFQFTRRGTQGWRQSEEQTADKRRADRKQQHMPIEMDFVSARQAARPEEDERANPDGCQQDAERTPEQAQHRALGQTLPDQTTSASSERYAHSEFTLTRNGARQQEAGDIDASDQQDQGDGAEQQPERGTDIAGQVPAKRLGLEDAAGIHIRVLFRQTTSDDGGLGLGLEQRCAGPQTCDNVKEIGRAILHSHVSDLSERGEHVGGSVQLEARGRDADHGVWLSIENNWPADG